MSDDAGTPTRPRRGLLLALPVPAVIAGAFAFGGWRGANALSVGLLVAAVCALLVCLVPALWDDAAQARALAAWREAPATRRLPALPYTQPGSPADALARHGALLPALAVNVLRSRNGLSIAALLAAVVLAAGLDSSGFALVIAMALVAQFAVVFALLRKSTFRSSILLALLFVALPLALGLSRAAIAVPIRNALPGTIAVIACAPMLLRFAPTHLAVAAIFILYSLFALAT